MALLTFRLHSIIYNIIYKCKKSFNLMNEDVGMGWTMQKIMETRKHLSNAIKDTSTIMRNPLPECVGRVTHDCASIPDSIAKVFPCFHDFSHGPSHPYIPIHSIE